METFTQLFGDLLAFVYHCFDRIVIYGYLSGLSRPEQVVHFFRNVVGVAVVDKEVFSRRTADYQAWVEAFARNHRLPIEWAEKGVRKEDHVLPWQRRIARDDAYGVYFIFKSMEQGPSFRVSVPKYATKDPVSKPLEESGFELFVPSGRSVARQECQPLFLYAGRLACWACWERRGRPWTCSRVSRSPMQSPP